MVSVDDFNAFLNLLMYQFQACFAWLNAIEIAGLSMFDWIMAFMAVGAIFAIIRVFAGADGVSVSSVGSGAAEQIRVAQGEARRKAFLRAQAANASKDKGGK